MAKNNSREAGDTLSGAIKNTAPKMLEGQEYFGREDYVVDQMASYYDEDKEEVRKRLQAAVEKLPKAQVRPEDRAAKDAATKALAEAQEAQQFADEAVAEAKRKGAIAAAAVAAAEGKVPVTVPRTFNLNFNGTVHLIKAGTATLPREQAEHPYSKLHGVTITGVPVAADQKKA